MLSRSTVTHAFTTLRRILDLAVVDGAITANPCASVPRTRPTEDQRGSDHHDDAHDDQRRTHDDLEEYMDSVQIDVDEQRPKTRQGSQQCESAGWVGA